MEKRKRHGGVSKIISLFVAIMLTFVVAALGLTACDGGSDADGTVTVVVSAGGDVRSYEIDLASIEDGASAIALLDHLEQAGELDYEISGPMLSKVGHLVEKPEEGIYVGIWTSVEDDVDPSGVFGSVEYEGMTLEASGLGITDMHYTDGCIIYFGELIYR